MKFGLKEEKLMLKKKIMNLLLLNTISTEKENFQKKI